jgi:putative DeoR family transcriptional regulator (stage III sporulation protein D)
LIHRKKKNSPSGWKNVRFPFADRVISAESSHILDWIKTTIPEGDMRFDSYERSMALGQYIAENRATVRETAAQFGVSKSTVHRDVTEKLRRDNPALYAAVAEILAQNKAERHLRGGEATRQKYLHLRGQRAKK